MAGRSPRPTSSSPWTRSTTRSYNPESTDGFDRITSVETPDPLTAIVHYREVYAPYALQFIRGCLPKHLLEGRDIDRAGDYNRSLLGTGPYRVAEWKTGEYILLERVPTYWRGAPKIAQPALQVPVEHQHAHQSAQGRRGAYGGDGAVGQVPRAGGGPGPLDPSHAGQRLRARHAQSTAVLRLRRRSRSARADAGGRSRAHRANDPRRPGAGHARTDSAGVVGVQQTMRASYPFDPAARARAPRRSRLARRQRRRHPRARRAAALPSRSSRRRASRCARASHRCCSASSATSARTCRSRCTTAPASARSGSKAASTRCCTGGRCRPIRS